MSLIDKTMESVSNLVTFHGALGEYSIGLHLAVASGCVLLIAMMVIAIVKLRGQGNGLVVICLQDLLFAVGCALLVFTFLGSFFFMGRAFWRAITWHMSSGDRTA